MKNYKEMYKLLLIFIVLTSCKGYNDVTYEVDCSKSGFSITYQEQDNTIQETVYNDNWSKTFKAHSGDFVYISAQTLSENAEIEVRIIRREFVISEATSTGDYVIATVSEILE